MKLPIQVAPVQRGNSTYRYSTSSGIMPSNNLCSCTLQGVMCLVNWSNCPAGTRAFCKQGFFNCLCMCCRMDTDTNGNPVVTDDCTGPYE